MRVRKFREQLAPGDFAAIKTLAFISEPRKLGGINSICFLTLGPRLKIQEEKTSRQAFCLPLGEWRGGTLFSETLRLQTIKGGGKLGDLKYLQERVNGC